MHNYLDQVGTFPPGFKGVDWGTWLVWVLPYIEQQPAFNAWNSVGDDRYDQGIQQGMFRYGGVANMTVTTRRYNAYYCPSDPNNLNLAGGAGWPVTAQNYVVNFGNTRHDPAHDLSGQRGELSVPRRTVQRHGRTRHRYLGMATG